MSIIRDPKDFASGAIFIAFGAAALLMARSYEMGTALRMGPAFFPSILGGLLCLIGVAGVVRSLVKPGEGIKRLALKQLVLVVAAALVFGYLVRGTGVVVAVVLLVLISGYASAKFRVLPYLLLGVGMAAFVAIVFIHGLGLQMRMFGPWLGT